MKYIFLNLKRFDIPTEFGGVNRLAPVPEWGKTVVESTQEALSAYSPEQVTFAAFLPEAHLLSAAAARKAGSALHLGSQGVHRLDTASGGNFGAFTTSLPAAAVCAMGMEWTLIGHCEERNNYAQILAEAGVHDPDAVNRLLNQEVRAAAARGLKILYCIGEKSEEQENWQQVLQAQIETGLAGVDRSQVVIAYEPVWSIGPGKTPADKPYITKVARFVKQLTGGMEIVYGGGLKSDNASMLASIDEIDGGLIALTRFSGEIGFYPDEYLEIIRLYLGN